MEITIPDQLAALAHPRRLDLFRLLMRRYPDSVPAGEIAQALRLKPNTASVYLSALRQAGLITQARQGTSLLYAVDMQAVRGMFGGLLGDCCANRPDICTLGDRRARWTGDGPLDVLFLCTRNSARSIMAEAILNSEGGARFRARSAGTEPADAINPMAREVLAAHGYAVDALRPRNLSAFAGPDAPRFDFVITVCDRAANEDCPTWPGQPLGAHWGVADPAQAGGDDATRRAAFDRSFEEIRRLVRQFLALPFDTLDPAAMQARLDDIARHRGAA